MIWQGNLLLPVYGFLKDNFDGINKYIVRFDYWLEMTISNADYLQELFPRMIVDFKETEKRLPEDCRIVCFARKPKPEDYPAEWVRYYWV